MRYINLDNETSFRSYNNFLKWSQMTLISRPGMPFLLQD
jgi:hypothetical protein